jgi:hypothetical protein
VYDPASALHRFAVRVAARLDQAQRLDFEASAGARLGPAEVKAVVAVLPGWRALSWLVALPSGYAALRGLLLVLEGQLTPVVKPAPRPPLVEQLAWGVSFVGTSLVFIAIVSQMLVENWAVPAEWKPVNRPGWMTGIVDSWQVPQGWSMFAPDVPRQDVRLVVDATLADGTHVDPLTGAPPDFQALEHGPWFMNQHWCEVHARMPNWRHHWRNFRDYLTRRPQALGWGDDKRVVGVEVFKLSGDMPLPGSQQHENVRVERLFGDEPL